MTAAKSSYLFDKHISSCLGPYWLLTCETFLRVPHAAVQTSVPASDPAFFIRLAGPDAFVLSRERVFVMTDFILVYFISDCVNLFCSREHRIRGVGGWEGLLFLRAGLLAGLTALWLEPRESLHQIERHPEQLEESQGWPTGLFSCPHPPEKVASPSDLLFNGR